MIVLVLPLVVLQFLLGPATLIVGLIALCATGVAFFEEILLWDIVAVDVAKQGPSFLLSGSVFLACIASLGLSYVLFHYDVYDKVYALLGEALRDIRPPEQNEETSES